MSSKNSSPSTTGGYEKNLSSEWVKRPSGEWVEVNLSNEWVKRSSGEWVKVGFLFGESGEWVKEYEPDVFVYEKASDGKYVWEPYRMTM